MRQRESPSTPNRSIRGPVDRRRSYRSSWDRAPTNRTISRRQPGLLELITPSMIALIGASPVPPAMHSRGVLVGGRGHLAARLAEQQVSPDWVLCTSDPLTMPAAYTPDMQVYQPVLPRRVGDREVAPDPWPARHLHRHVLAWRVLQRLVRLDRQHREVGLALVVLHHLADPPGRLQSRVPLSGGQHGGGDTAESRVPRGLRLGGPVVPVEMANRFKRARSGRAHNAVLDAELPVTAAQLAEVIHQRIRVIDPAILSGPERRIPFHMLMHCVREHGANFRIAHEKARSRSAPLPDRDSQ